MGCVYPRKNKLWIRFKDADGKWTQQKTTFHLGSEKKARRMLLTGQRVPARELYRLGVVEECVAATDLMPVAMALAADIASKSPLAVRMLKESFNAVETQTLRDGYRLEQNMTVALSRSEDAREARTAFVEKRKPVFKGR